MVGGIRDRNILLPEHLLHQAIGLVHVPAAG